MGVRLRFRRLSIFLDRDNESVGFVIGLGERCSLLRGIRGAIALRRCPRKLWLDL